MRGGGGGEECGEPDFADAEVSSPGPAPSDPSAAVETWTDTTDDCRSFFLFFCVCNMISVKVTQYKHLIK